MALRWPGGRASAAPAITRNFPLSKCVDNTAWRPSLAAAPHAWPGGAPALGGAIPMPAALPGWVSAATGRAAGVRGGLRGAVCSTSTVSTDCRSCQGADSGSGGGGEGTGKQVLRRAHGARVMGRAAAACV
eukprot:364651-Chlamydomonas_euryale.AAC.13